MAVLVTGEGPQVNKFEQISPLLLKSGRVGYPGHMYGGRGCRVSRSHVRSPRDSHPKRSQDAPDPRPLVSTRPLQSLDPVPAS